mmetsp:Transcript_105865/g.287351  ORF Transcript_105865/g.287351 Transcript_105865/m.287351 type:complete len:227 (-) Transcript_105865:763-1443(-)
MASPNFLMSSWAAAMPSWALAMAVSASEMSRSNPFFLSSASSNCLPQYSFLLSSSTCSRFRVATIPSIIAITFAKPIFLPLSASMMTSRSALLLGRAAFRRRSRARARTAADLRSTCTSAALGEGRVFLNSSRASSSLRILMVSAIATSSSWRVLLRASHSASFVAQPCSSSFSTAWSSSSCASVSERSFFSSTIETPSSPDRWVFDSICAVRASTSFFLADMSSS